MSGKKGHIGAAFAALVGAGCVAQVSFDVVGHAASVQGSWTIADATPSAQNCAALGIDYVRVRFFRGDAFLGYGHGNSG